MSRFEPVLPLRPVASLLRHRFTKFGLVGFSGTLVNLAVLYLSQENLLRAIRPEARRLSYALVLAIVVSTVHNFGWNRHWTWRDRKEAARHGVLVQLGQYFLASWLSIALQFAITRALAVVLHYLVANALAIAAAAVVTYLLNDLWTFAPGKACPASDENANGREPVPALCGTLKRTVSARSPCRH